VLGIALAVSTWRWIGAAAEDRAVRWFWALAVAALGLPVWVLCRAIEPSRRTLSLRLPGNAGIVEPLLVTPRRGIAPGVPAMQA
jgi:hypothetical protein